MFNNELNKQHPIDYSVLVVATFTFKFVQFFSVSLKNSIHIIVLLSIVFLIQIIYLIVLRKYRDKTKDENIRKITFHFGVFLLIEAFVLLFCSANLIGDTLKEGLFFYLILATLLLITLLCLKIFFKKRNAKQSISTAQETQNINPIVQKFIGVSVPSSVVVITLCIRLKIIELEKFVIIGCIICAFLLVLPFAVNPKLSQTNQKQSGDGSMIEHKDWLNPTCDKYLWLQ